MCHASVGCRPYCCLSRLVLTVRFTLLLLRLPFDTAPVAVTQLPSLCALFATPIKKRQKNSALNIVFNSPPSTLFCAQSIRLSPPSHPLTYSLCRPTSRSPEMLLPPWQQPEQPVALAPPPSSAINSLHVELPKNKQLRPLSNHAFPAMGSGLPSASASD